ncbi:TIGR04086 family membrane protein [Brevibacillus daliensis]|uniref:TIGR04086 family membrane protein n=1 Tax=Brevibacillus daliensis TaxID=2892995 RepID=UPI001E39E8C9|nr:TIGR04086 family membrane protein [Brevibacillus daliensis]
MRSHSTSVMTGLFLTLGLVLLGSIITALLLSFSDIQESSLPYFSYAINVISLLIGGYVTGRKSGVRGWYYGGLAGLGYFLLVLLIGFLGFDAPLELNTLLYTIFAFVIAAIGGVFGVNSSNRR